MIRPKGLGYKRRRGYYAHQKMRKQKTIRYCPVCEKETTFKYNVNIGHSECIRCGSRIIRKETREIMTEQELNELDY